MPAEARIQRRVEWIDTDAAGIWHYSTAIRFAESAESQLHRELGTDVLTAGGLPRVHVEFDFFAPLRFDELATITVRVDDVGTSSLTLAVEIDGEHDLAARGRVVAALIDGETGRPRSWPEEARRLLLGG